MDDFTALYLPSDCEKNPSKSGFSTKEEAEQYIFTQMCYWCKEERECALQGKPIEDSDRDPSLYPACSCEWIVVPTKDAGLPFDELLDAAGFKAIYVKEEQK